MKLRFVQIGLSLVLTAVAATAQTSSRLEEKYGAPLQIYGVRPGVMMSVEYGEDKQVCVMRIERHNATESMLYLDTTIPTYLAKEIVDELVPAGERGVKGEFSGLSLMLGQSESSLEDYENAAITYHRKMSSTGCNGTIAIIIRWKNRGCKQKS